MCIDVFSSGIWSELSAIQDPELQQLAESLPSIVLQGKAVSTVKEYAGAYNRWKTWATARSEVGSDLPPSPVHISLEAVNALSWVNQIATVEDTTTHPLVVQVLGGIKRGLACATSKKEPITPAIFAELVSRFGQHDASLSDIRTLTICLLGFAGFFRFDEMAKISELDVVVL